MNKKEIEKLKKQLSKKDRLVWDELSATDTIEAFSLAEDYKGFLDRSKTEREAAREIIARAEENGFVSMETALKAGSAKPHQKIYALTKERCVAMAVLGEDPIVDGINLIASHIDSPRLDLKQNPVYEDTDLALLKTHYYGGIRKYQWLSVPLALHGRIIKGDGECLDVVIGEEASDPVFVVTDLLPHLAGKVQENKKLSEAFEGEKLNLLAGSRPLGNDTVSERFKLGLLNLLHERYGITEADFVSAELEAVPANKARDIGIDRSLVGAYGQDDRICAFTQLEALLGTKTPKRTAVGFFFDKEEIGSEGNTGAQSAFTEDFISDLLMLTQGTVDDRTLRKTLINTWALSGDVNAAMDPDFKEVHEKMNAAKLGHGICMTKFTGARGKSGSSDASAEFVGQVRNLFDKNKIVWQTGELGKIDQGGGGTIAKFLAQKGMEILDCGPGILSMHSPFEIASKADIYMTFKGYKTFYA
jgi:aspartyl aminopeptidase